MNVDFSFPQRQSVNSPSTPTRSSFTSTITTDSPPKPSNARPNSHHRRRSSVSTRRESCEIMGVLPDSPVKESHSLGDQRQRALWALEGNRTLSTAPPMFGFQKVNIPDWTTPENENNSFDWSSSSSSITSSTSSGSSAHILPSFLGVSSSLAGKRDSFGKNLVTASASLKAELSTLLEEDEEDDTDDSVVVRFSSEHLTESASWEPAQPLSNRRDINHEAPHDDAVIHEDDLIHESTIPILPPSTPKVIPASPLSTNVTPTSSKPRPPSLSLRPLSLVSALPESSSPLLPTPNTSASISPSPRISGLKFLTLSSSSSIPASATPPHASSSSSSTPASQRSLVSGLITPSPSPSGSSANSPFIATPSPTVDSQRRRSRINYRSSSIAEESSPVASSPATNRHSLPISPQGQRSISPESISSSVSSMTDFFQNQAVASLLSRIVSLEEALHHGSPPDYSSRPSSIPLTPDTVCSAPSPAATAGNCSQSFSVFGASSSSRESSSANSILEELENLKAERDELSSDITGWRTRCNDLQHSSDLMKRRLTESTNEIWSLKGKCNIFNIQASAAQEMAATASNKVVELQGSLSALEERNGFLMNENEKLVAINESLKSQVSELNGRVEMMDKVLNSERAGAASERLSQEAIRLAHLKEKNRFEGERDGWDMERREMEKEISKLVQELADANRQLAVFMTGTPDLMKTPKADSFKTNSSPVSSFKFPASSPTPTASPPTVSWFGGRSSLDSSNSSSDADSLFSAGTPNGFGGMNGGFKFGGATSSMSSHSSSTSSGSLHHQSYGSLGVVAEEDEDEEPSKLEKVLEVDEEDEESDVPASSRSSGSHTPSTHVEEDDEEEDALAGYEDEDSSFESPEGDEDEDEDEDVFTAPRTTLTLSPNPSGYGDSFIVTPPTPSPASESQTTPRKHAHRRSASMVQAWKFPKMMPSSQSSRRLSQQSISSFNFNNRPVKKQIDIDPFFACLEDPANLKDDVELFGTRLSAEGKNSQKHKRLPSGCPAFWLDLNGEDEQEFSFGLGRSRQQEMEQFKFGGEEKKTTRAREIESSSETEVEDEDLMSSSTEVESLSTPLSITPTSSSPVLSNASPVEPHPLTKTGFSDVSRNTTPRPASIIVSRPIFTPAPAPLSAPIQSRVTSVPPPAVTAMTIPVRSHSPPQSHNSASQSLTSRLTFQTLSSLISWTAKPPKPTAAPLCVLQDEEDENSRADRHEDEGEYKRKARLSIVAHSPLADRSLRQSSGGFQFPSASPSSTSPTHSLAKVIKAKHVDPTIMRERLRTRLEKEGRLSSGSLMNAAVDTIGEKLSMSPCSRCSNSKSAVMQL